jgi:hypothetical protein
VIFCPGKLTPCAAASGGSPSLGRNRRRKAGCEGRYSRHRTSATAMALDGGSKSLSGWSWVWSPPLCPYSSRTQWWRATPPKMTSKQENHAEHARTPNASRSLANYPPEFHLTVPERTSRGRCCV